MYWTPDVERDYAALSSRLSRAGWSVSISPRRMLEQARDKKVYHTLVKAELTEYLRANSEAFDLIVSADTPGVFCRLDGCRRRGRGGTAAERQVCVYARTRGRGIAPVSTLRLELHGRYSHSQAYVEELVMSSGLQSTIVQAELRLEAGVPVPGLVVRAAKSASATLGQR